MFVLCYIAAAALGFLLIYAVIIVPNHETNSIPRWIVQTWPEHKKLFESHTHPES